MPTVIFQPSICSETPTRPNVTGCEESTRSEWSVISKPVGSQVIFDDDSIAEPFIDVSLDGEYVFQLCCYFDEGIVSVDGAPVVPELNCPLGVVAGQTGTVYLTGCEDGNVQQAVAGGVATGVTFDSQGVGTVTTDATMPGTASVTVDCVLFDEDGVPSTTEFFCEFEVIAADIDLVCTTSPAVSRSFIVCGQSCECTEVTAVFDCGETVCETAQIGIVFKDCPECIEDDECEPLEFEELVGSEVIAAPPFIGLIDCGCYEEYIYDKDRPAFFWNNLCSCPGWTLDAPAVAGSTVYNACSCNPGQKWCFEGSATIVASGPAMLVDSLIIWGHNISDGSVTTSPLAGIGGPTVDIGVVDDGACIEGYTRPVIVNFADVPESVTDLTITITAANGGLVCIDQIFIGQKMFLPEDAMPESFQNPHDGSDYSLEFKESECGPLSRSLKHTPVELSFDIECADIRWIKQVWRPYLRYAQRHGVYFQHSRNNCPEDVFCGWLPNTIGPSSYTELDGYTVTFTSMGYITQPQPKLLV